jgi:ArsR family transcriptional regulator
MRMPLIGRVPAVAAPGARPADSKAHRVRSVKPILRRDASTQATRHGADENREAVVALAALAQETRLAVFRLLVEKGPEGLAAGEIAERLELAGATLSFHLKELAHAQLVAARQAGRFIYYSANYPTINGLIDYLTRNCCQGVTCDIACAPVVRRKGRTA